MSYKSFVVVGLVLLAVVARAQQPLLACPLSYDPVVDPDSGLPFYNECLARLQLPATTKIVRRAALEEQLATAAAAANIGATATATGGARLLRGTDGSTAAPSAPSAHDYLKLLPKPAAGTGDGADVFVDLDIINKYYREGFVYVGRPGFLTPTADDSETTAPKDSSSAAPSRPAPLSVDGSRVSLRIAYPQGDMYVKIWSASELTRLTTQHTTTTSSSSSSSLAQPNTPQHQSAADNDNDDSDLLSRGTAALAAAATAAATAAAASTIPTTTTMAAADPQRTARRLLLASSGGSSGNGNGNNGGKTGGPNRTEVTLSGMSYPYSAVSYINITRLNGPSTWCTGALAGPTSRLVLTAAHCVYDFDAVSGVGKGYHQAFVVIPAQARDAATNTIAMPYGRISTNLAEVMAQWMLKGNFDFDIGLIRLSVHATLAGKAPGSLGFNYTCAQKTFTLASAGYAGDSNFTTGTLWRQNLTTSADQCGGSVSQKVAFAFSPGQDGSPLWTPTDNVIRFVASRAGLAVPISPIYYAWMLDFTTRSIINLVPLQLQGGSSTSLFFTCDSTSRKCVGARKSNATSWYFHPISVPRKWAMRLPGSNLCLTVNSTAANIAATSSNATVAVYLAPCNTDGRFTFSANQLWNVDTFAAVGAIAAAKTDNEGYLSCAGEGQPLLARGAAACTGQPACTWKQVSA